MQGQRLYYKKVRVVIEKFYLDSYRYRYQKSWTEYEPVRETR